MGIWVNLSGRTVCFAYKFPDLGEGKSVNKAAPTGTSLDKWPPEGRGRNAWEMIGILCIPPDLRSHNNSPLHQQTVNRIKLCACVRFCVHVGEGESLWEGVWVERYVWRESLSVQVSVRIGALQHAVGGAALTDKTANSWASFQIANKVKFTLYERGLFLKVVSLPSQDFPFLCSLKKQLMKSNFICCLCFRHTSHWFSASYFILFWG